ncbi:MAG: hypothetical protein NC092_04165 [Butyrivibrio sp.]|nr:hypothetical protein [Muribaculum sp.]MCM1551870.1 hypothetical protein [Butyrivibrio sp.]
MRIDSSSVGMQSNRAYQATKATYRGLSFTNYRAGSLTYNGNALNAAVANGQSGNEQSVSENNQDKKDQGTDTSEQKLYTIEDWKNSMEVGRGRVNLRSSESRTMEDLRQVTVRYIFDLLFANRRTRWNNWMKENGLTRDNSWSEQNVASQSVSSQGSSVQSGSIDQLFMPITNIKALNYVQETFSFEQESTSFSTVGTVRTSDGREINFNVDIGMSRQFQETFQEELQAASVKMCDPLVINLDTDVAELSDQKFYFDIDADGDKDEISGLGSKSGYLALDKNGDGVINDGSELFGTASGDGFADLAAYDEDGNGWIDEGDAIWSKLKIWCKDENGKDVLYRLADKGVGAICLQNAATDFTLQGAQGQTNGAIRRTGVFLYENGNVGTVQHVDVAKYEQGA